MKKPSFEHIKKFFGRFSKQKIEQFIITHPMYLEVLEWSKNTSAPGFFSVPIYAVAVFLWKEIQKTSIGIRANSIAYSFFIALFPSILVMFTLVPYFSDLLLSFLPNSENYTVVMIEELNRLIPGIDIEIINEDELHEAVYDNLLAETIEDILRTPRYGLLSLGFFLAVYFASNGMMAMMSGFEKSYDFTFRKRTPLKTRLVAINLTFILGAMLFSSVLLIILGDVLLAKITSVFTYDWVLQISLAILRTLVFFALFYFGIAIIYRYGPATHQRFQIFSPGATLATVLSVLTSFAFSYYINNFSQYNKLYGSIGTVIILLLWLQINAFILLAGFELNAGIAVNRDLIKAEKEEGER